MEKEKIMKLWFKISVILIIFNYLIFLRESNLNILELPLLLHLFTLFLVIPLLYFAFKKDKK